MKLFLKKEISQKTITNCLVSVLYPIVLVTSTVQVNGVKTSFDYDDLHRLTAIQHQKGTEVLSQFNYALNADGKRNPLQKYLKYPTGQPMASVNRTVFYGYDNAGRLNAEQRQSTSTLVTNRPMPLEYCLTLYSVDINASATAFCERKTSSAPPSLV